MSLFEDDVEAAKAAECDGVQLIYGMEEVPDGVYLDTPENRAIILAVLEECPEYCLSAIEREQQSKTGIQFI